jgi:hypothetical protein
MPSPFPGMDPYLEDPGLWPDVHTRIITGMSDFLNEALRPKYLVRIEERIYISDEGDPGRSLLDEQIRERFLEIADRGRRKVVTVIEVLSPTNKFPGSRGLKSFRRKRKETMNSRSHWVEVDLLRTGVSLGLRKRLPPHEYFVHVSPVDRRPEGFLWPIRLDQRLPPIPIPLGPEDRDIVLDLQTRLSDLQATAASVWSKLWMHSGEGSSSPDSP